MPGSLKSGAFKNVGTAVGDIPAIPVPMSSMSVPVKSTIDAVTSLGGPQFLSQLKRRSVSVQLLNVGGIGDSGAISGLPAKYQIKELVFFDASAAFSLTKVDLRTQPGGQGSVLASCTLSALDTSGKTASGTISNSNVLSSPILYIRCSVSHSSHATVSCLLEILDLT